MRGDFQPVLPFVRIEDRIGVDAQIAEGVDGDQHMADIGVDFGIFESLFQIVVYGFIRDLADQREVRDPDLFLLGAFELGFLDLGLSAAGGDLRCALVLLAACALCDRLLLRKLAKQ